MMSFLLLHVISSSFIFRMHYISSERILDVEGSLSVIRRQFEQKSVVKFLINSGLENKDILAESRTYSSKKSECLGNPSVADQRRAAMQNYLYDEGLSKGSVLDHIGVSILLDTVIRTANIWWQIHSAFSLKSSSPKYGTA
jgi:hypothetical protein